MTYRRKDVDKFTFRKVQKYNVTNIFVSHGLEDCRLEDVELLYVLRLYILQIGTSHVQSLLAVSPLHLGVENCDRSSKAAGATTSV